MNGSDDEIEKKEKEVDKAVKEAEAASRREVKAKTKLDDAVKDAEALGIKTDNKNKPEE